MTKAKTRRTAISRVRALSAAILALTLALPAALAHADGPRTRTVVASGHSLYGAPWQIRFGEEHKSGGEPDYATFRFIVGTKAEQKERESGYYSSIPLPIPRTATFGANFGSDFDRYPESDVSGTTGPLVSRLALKMADGSELEAELLHASASVIKRYPRLAPFRFFDLFFPDTDEPTSIAAYDKAGHLLKKLSTR
jgi:hypothetical protein